MSDTPIMSVMGEAALDLARRGFPVFPCVPGTKKPLTEHGLKDASRDPEVIRAWWVKKPGANVAVATEGLVVVDVDVDGVAANTWLQDQPERLAELQAAPTVTTPSGGRHFYFQAGAERFRNSASKIAEAIDIRADGGYAVVAPSQTPDGDYRWVRGLPATITDLPLVPEWLADEIRPASGKKKPRAQHEGRGGPVIEGARNDTLTRHAGALRRRGFQASEITARLQKMNADRCVPPLDEAEVARIAESVAMYPVGKGAVNGALPEVVLDTDEHRVNDEVVAALASDDELFQRGGRLVRVIPREGMRGDVTPSGFVISELEPPTLRELITRRVSLVKANSKGEMVPAHPPAWNVAAVHGRGHWAGVRHLLAVSESPILRPDGTVVHEPGYDAATGVLYRPNAEFDPIHPEANREEAWAAAELLCDVVRDFSFESDIHRATWLALLLTIVGRHAFSGPAPMVLIDANIRGAGKTLLAQVAGLIGLGRTVPTTSYNHDSNELRKQITMTALEGEQFVIFDNLPGVIGNDALDRALTTTRWRDRRLGGNEKVDAPLVTSWAATGNNPSIEADTARRVVHVRLKEMSEHPEDRTGFQHPDLMGYVRGDRARLFMAAITILSMYLKAGCPDMKLRPMGSYEGWSRVVRGALVWCGQPDPCLGRDGLEVMADNGMDAGRTLIEAWRRYDPNNRGQIVAQLISTLYPAGGGGPSDEASVQMRAALEQLVGTSRQPTARTVGNKLRAMRDRLFDGWCISCDGAKGSKGKVWRLRMGPGNDSVTLVTVPQAGGEMNEAPTNGEGVTL